MIGSTLIYFDRFATLNNLEKNLCNLGLTSDENIEAQTLETNTFVPTFRPMFSGTIVNAVKTSKNRPI